jgi:hypothetical protein
MIRGKDEKEDSMSVRQVLAFAFVVFATGLFAAKHRRP